MNVRLIYIALSRHQSYFEIIVLKFLKFHDENINIKRKKHDLAFPGNFTYFFASDASTWQLKVPISPVTAVLSARRQQSLYGFLRVEHQIHITFVKNRINDLDKHI